MRTTSLTLTWDTLALNLSILLGTSHALDDPGQPLQAGCALIDRGAEKFPRIEKKFPTFLDLNCLKAMDLSRIQHGLDYRPKYPKGGRSNFRKSFIYLIRCNEYVKVGIADDPIKRLIELSTGCPYPLKLIHTWPTENACQDERCLHSLLRTRHFHGEWFILTESDVAELVAAHPVLHARTCYPALFPDNTVDWSKVS